MAVTTVFATPPTGNGSVQSQNSDYATARTGGTFVATANHQVGQTFSSPTYALSESFFLFDTSVIGADVVSAVVFSADGNTDQSTTDFIARLALSSYNGSQVIAADWVDGSTLSALTSLATWDSAGYSANYNAFTSTGAFAGAINTSGNTALIAFSERHMNGDVPTGTERVTFTDADATGTTTDPKLDITHAAAGGGTVGGRSLINAGLVNRGLVNGGLVN